MILNILSPTKAYLESYTEDELVELTNQLSYKNLSVQHQLKRLSKNFYFRNSNPVKYEQQYNYLKAQINQTLVFQDKQGKYIRPGSIPYLERLELQIVNNVQYPKPKKLAWFKPLPFKLYPYQEESVKKLLEVKHGNVELCTGSGKSLILLNICQQLGLKIAIIAPSKSIFNELYNLFVKHFGKGKIGRYGDGKRSFKNIMICIGDSLVNVKKDSPEWDFFSNLDCIQIDESHLFSSETLEEVNHNLFEKVPYRFYFSGTQTRGDGSTKLLQSIIGKTVCFVTAADAVKGNFICPHEYRIVQIESDSSFVSDDMLEMKRIHFLRNKNIASFIAKLANIELNKYGKQSLILVEELSQISMLLPLLNTPVVIAHSEKNKNKLEELGISKVDPEESVTIFNKGGHILIGTSCISTGTNIYPVHNCFNWVGSSSIIKTKQGAIGRSIRIGNHNIYYKSCIEKKQAIIWDFDIYNIEEIEHQLIKRIECYKESNSNIKYIKWK